jgi:uncharacterized protein (DUF58 family)
VSGARPTGRGVLVLVGAAIAYLVGWAFGTPELASLSLVLVLAVPIALGVVWRAARAPVVLTRRVPSHAVADQALHASVALAPAPRLVTARLLERCAGLGDPVSPLRRSGEGLAGSWVVERPARGRYRLAAELVLEDPLGLARSRVAIAQPGLVRVEPQLVELGAPRAPALARRDGMRRAFAANAGDGLAGVRDHEVGESLRRVHWRTTARRGRLTVRELEDHPREDMLVLLDALRHPEGAGRAPAFECAVRAAGSLALHAARAGMSVAFEGTGLRVGRVVVSSGSSDSGLLDALCAVAADGSTPLAVALGGTTESALWVVTSDLGEAVVERLRSLRGRRRALSVVVVDAGSWAGEPFAFAREVDQLARAGVELAVVGRDDDLAQRLAPLVARSVARVS